jgi:integral membrane sensor domain MASE1
MVENPLSKRGWTSVIFTAILSAVGSDLYQLFKDMVFESPSYYTLLAIAAIIGIGIVAGVALIVFDVYKQRQKQKKLPSGAVHPTFSGIETNPDKIDPE